MSGVNKAILVGRLGKDPTVSTLNSGGRVVKFSMATSETWKDKSTGEKRERTEWHNVVIYNDGLGSIVEKYCKKGSQVYVEGEIQTRKYNDREGHERYITEIVLSAFRGTVSLLGDKRDDNGGGVAARDDRDSGARNQASSKPAAQTTHDDLNDEIPF